MRSPAAALPPELAAFAGLLAAASDDRPGGGDMALVVAHPDDETIGLGGQLARLRDLAIVHVTDGAPANGFDARSHGFATPENYAAARRRELETAVAEAGIPAASLISFGVADQDAPKKMADIARRLADLIAARKPRHVLTHPFEGGHPDHDATALAVWAACRLTERTGATPPVVMEMASYHLSEGGPLFQRFAGAAPELVLPLGEADRSRKRRMLAAHASQSRTLKPFTAAEERFRLAPAYDFSALPNEGRLLYETMEWGLRSPEWLALSCDALKQLGLHEGAAA